MRVGTFSGIVVFAFTLAAAKTAAADDAQPRGIELGFRAGAALPLGDADNASKLKDVLTVNLPLWFDAGYRISPRVYVGAYFQYGVLSVGDKVSTACSVTGGDCFAYDLQTGIMAAFHILPDKKFDPWVGLGIGYEWASIRGVGPGDTNEKLSGLQFVNLQLGGDYKATPTFGFGPFVSMSFGSYSSESVGENTPPGFSSALHEWFTFGVRGVYDISI
jgi:hypothetical protein